MEKSTVFELVYCSMAAPSLTSDDISDSLDTSRTFNKENNITGCLLYCNDEFAQTLEGDEKVVLELYESIKKDKRHSFVLLLGSGQKSTCLFPTWNMAFQNLNNEQKLPSKEFIKNFIAFSELADKPTQISEIFFNVSNHTLIDNTKRKLG
ncbi:MAG: hypothetical protein ACI8SE_000091 [Bacteroidia bacterium]|jgi:hypothetical protein